MSRGLDPAVQAALSSGQVRIVQLFYADFPGGAVRLTTYVRNMIWQGETWFSVSGKVGADQFEETLSPEISGAEISFEVNELLKSVVTSQDLTGRTAQVYQGFVDAAGELIAPPTKLFDGLMNGLRCEEDPRTTLRATIPVASRWANFDNRVGLKTNAAQWRGLFPSDAIFDDIAGLANETIEWG